MPTVLAVDREGNRICNEFHITSGNDGDFITPKTLIAGSYYYGILGKEQIQQVAENGFLSEVNFPSYFGQGGVPRNMPIPEVYDILERAIEAGYVYKADTIEELAGKLSVDPAVLAGTVNRYNELCGAGEDKDQGKDNSYLIPIEVGPFYAVTGSVRPFSTGGALDVDTQLRVQKAGTDTPIPGLYAVGNDSMGGLLSGAKNYIGYGGAIQGWCITSGRMARIYAGAYAAQEP